MICHLLVVSTSIGISASPITRRARSITAASLRSGSPWAGSYMNSITHSFQGRTQIKVPLPTQ
ncbi:hypothetical protein D3C80_1111010 [compost metagenome]